MFWVTQGLWLDHLIARPRIGSAGGSGIAFCHRRCVRHASVQAIRARGTRDHRKCTDQQTGPDGSLKKPAVAG